MSTVRLAAFAEITGRTREVVRNMQKNNALPWEDKRPEGEYRRYDGYHALAMVVAEMLVTAGASVAYASELVRDQANVLENFLDTRDGDATPCFVFGLLLAEESSIYGLRWRPWHFLHDGGAHNITNSVADALASVGRVRKWDDTGETQRVLGPLNLYAVCVNEAYEILKRRAAAAEKPEDRFEINGRIIRPLRASTDGGAE